MPRRDLLRLLGATARIPCVPGKAAATVRFGRAAHRAVRAGSLRALSPETSSADTPSKKGPGGAAGAGGRK